MIALSQRVSTGLGQHVDASVQQACSVVCSAEIEGPYALFGRILSRHGRARGSVTLKDGSIFYNPLLWECKDGDIAFNLLLNPTSVKANTALMEGLKRDGIDIKFLNDWQWDKQTWKDLSPDQANEVINIIGQFFKKHTKAELLDMAIKNRFQLGPCNDAEDVLNHPQLAARDYWREIEYPDLGTSFKYPGGAVKMSEGDCGPRTRAPRIGEHNTEIYQEIGISGEKLTALKEKGII
jgi:crotonobetainyl-CoA:carnitine CoA-transferase CaiB-like acyl-CoA transferase